MKKITIGLAIFFFVTPLLGRVTGLSSLPDELRIQILAQSATWQDAAQSIRKMRESNKKWRDLIDNPQNMQLIVSEFAKKFNISKILASVYLNTPATMKWINARLQDDNKEYFKIALRQAFRECFNTFDGSPQAQAVMQYLIKTVQPQSYTNGQIARLEDGSIVTVHERKQLQKVTPDGFLDRTFGNNGILQPDLPKVSDIRQIGLQRNQKDTLLIANFELMARINLKTGLPDASFGIDGKIEKQSKFEDIGLFSVNNDDAIYLLRGPSQKIIDLYGPDGKLKKQKLRLAPKTSYLDIVCYPSKVFTIESPTGANNKTFIITEFNDEDLSKQVSFFSTLFGPKLSASSAPPDFNQQADGTIVLGDDRYLSKQTSESDWLIKRFLTDGSKGIEYSFKLK